jgi:uncharacterized membrane protein YkoI
MERRLQRVIATLGAAGLSLTVAACSGGNSTTPSPTPMSASSALASAADPTNTTGMGTSIVDTPTSAASPGTDVPITKERAAEIVTDKYGGHVFTVEADTEQGHPTWEVEIADSNQGRIEVDVDQRSGEIVKVEQD